MTSLCELGNGAAAAVGSPNVNEVFGCSGDGERDSTAKVGDFAGCDCSVVLSILIPVSAGGVNENRGGGTVACGCLAKSVFDTDGCRGSGGGLKG